MVGSYIIVYTIFPEIVYNIFGTCCRYSDTFSFYPTTELMKTSQSQSEENELLLSAKEGSLEAFTRLYEIYFPMVFRRVNYLVPHQDVEDVTQEIFIATMRSLKGFRGESKFSTWLRTLTNRQVAEYYRRKRHPEVEISEQ